VNTYIGDEFWNGEVGVTLSSVVCGVTLSFQGLKKYINGRKSVWVIADKVAIVNIAGIL